MVKLVSKWFQLRIRAPAIKITMSTISSNLNHFYTTEQEVTYRGFEIRVFPGVFVPRQISKIQGISAKNLRMYHDKSVLDMGSGTGIQSVVAFKSGAKFILAVDINPDACRNSQYNFQMYEMKNAFIRESDLFQNVSEKFDSIVAYLPSIDAPAGNMQDMAVYDPGFTTFRNFLKEAKNHLNSGGVIYASWVNINNSIDTFNAMIEEYQYKILSSKLIIHEGEEWWMFDIQ